MKKINETLIADLDMSRIEQYENVEKDAAKQKIVDVSDVTYMPVYNTLTGEVVAIINPKDIAAKTQYVINGIKSSATTRFMSPYLQKKIIWSNEAQTAFTNGIRIAYSPIFAFQQYKKGRAYLKSIAQKLAILCEKNNIDYDVEQNMASALYVRFVLIHEIYHMIYQHVRRTILYIKDPLDRQLSYIANVAQDLEINRDIVCTWPEFEIVVKDGFLWYLDDKFKRVDTGEYFEHESWEEIYDYLLEHKDQVPNLKQNPKVNNPKDKLSKYPAGFADGWKKAADKIKNKKIDPLKFNL